MIRVLIVDDHGLVRMGVKRLLEDASNIKIIGEAENGREALSIARELEPDVVLLDIRMPGMSGLEVTKKLLRHAPDIKILVFTAYTEEPFPSRMLKSGASGYITKGCNKEDLIHAIKSVFAGQRYINSTMAKRIILKLSHDVDKTPFDLLSERELQVMYMLTHGLRVTEIAERLTVTPKTVNSYRYRMFEKLNIDSDVELMHLAMRHGVLKSDLPEGLNLVEDDD